jgi:hypothetical protein
MGGGFLSFRFDFVVIGCSTTGGGAVTGVDTIGIGIPSLVIRSTVTSAVFLI